VAKSPKTEAMMRFRTRVLLLCTVFSLAASVTVLRLDAGARVQSAAGQQTLTNDDVVSMTKAGLPAEVVAAKIKTSNCHFDTSPESLARLKAAGVADGVLLAMVQASSPTAAVASGTSTSESAEDAKVRVFVTDSQSWSTYGYSWMHGNATNIDGGSVSKGGARPQTVEIIKTLGERCPELVVTNQPQRANYVITLDHEGGKGLLRVRNKVAVFNVKGDAVFSDSTLTLGESVQRGCNAIKKDTTR
jgi:hypothetical protein